MLNIMIAMHRREKANIDLCCCGLKVNDVDVASHPATRPTGPTRATTKPAGDLLFCYSVFDMLLL
jgi:hypothetical protein